MILFPFTLSQLCISIKLFLGKIATYSVVCRVLEEIIERFPHCAQQRGGLGRTLLHSAVESKKLETVKYVLTKTHKFINVEYVIVTSYNYIV